MTREETDGHALSADTPSASRPAFELHDLGGKQEARAPGPRVNLDPDKPDNGIARLVLTLVKFLHELMERQAIRRMDEGSLTEAEIEKLGLALMKQSEELARLRDEFGLTDEQLNLDLGPLGRLV